jgi:hypothetical protein
MGVTPESRGGPEVVFGVTFPAAGKYRVFGQFKRGGEMIVVPINVEVKEPILPAWLIKSLLNE